MHRKKKKCPISGCFGKMASSPPSVCAAIDMVLRDGLSAKEYREAESESGRLCGGLRDENDAAVAGNDAAPPTPSSKAAEDEAPPPPPSSDDTYVHFGVGCDGCGIYPIVGRRYKCLDCSEEVGFDLCGDCHDDGVHKRDVASSDNNNAAAGTGRFNQRHLPGHRMEEVERTHTLLHEIQRRNPDVPLSQLIQMVEMQFTRGDSDNLPSRISGEQTAASEQLRSEQIHAHGQLQEQVRQGEAVIERQEAQIEQLERQEAQIEQHEAQIEQQEQVRQGNGDAGNGGNGSSDEGGRWWQCYFLPVVAAAAVAAALAFFARSS